MVGMQPRHHIRGLVSRLIRTTTAMRRVELGLPKNFKHENRKPSKIQTGTILFQSLQVMPLDRFPMELHLHNITMPETFTSISPSLHLRKWISCLVKTPLLHRHANESQFSFLLGTPFPSHRFSRTALLSTMTSSSCDFCHEWDTQKGGYCIRVGCVDR